MQAPESPDRSAVTRRTRLDGAARAFRQQRHTGPTPDFARQLAERQGRGGAGWFGLAARPRAATVAVALVLLAAGLVLFAGDSWLGSMGRADRAPVELAEIRPRIDPAAGGDPVQRPASSPSASSPAISPPASSPAISPPAISPSASSPTSSPSSAVPASPTAPDPASAKPVDGAAAAPGLSSVPASPSAGLGALHRYATRIDSGAARPPRPPRPGSLPLRLPRRPSAVAGAAR